MNKLILGIMLLAMLVAFSAPAMGACTCNVATNGCPCACGTSGLIEGTVYTSGGEPAPSTQRIYDWDFDEIPDEVDIKWARLYWHIWMPGDRTVATFCNATGCTDRTIDLTPANCNQNETEGFYGGGCGTGWVYWNVTDLVESGANNATVDNAPDGYPPGDGRTFQMYLVVVYEKEGYPQTNYWVNQGYMDLAGGGTTYTTDFGSAYDTTNGTLWQLALAHNDKVEIWFNGVGSNLVATTYGLGSYGLLEEYEIPAGWITTTGVNSMTWKNWDAYHHPALAIFMDSRPPGKDLIVEEVGFNPETPRPDQNFAVTATVKNRGDLDITNSFNVRLYVNGVPNSTDQQVMSLGAGSSTPVTFPNVNLPEGCYEFKVVADIGDTIGESNENNNETAVNHQVGYVIIVNENSDFFDLENEGLAREAGGTYYIEDLTITNCAGDGITIENVNVPYVIDGCTIHDCTGGSNGVFLNNVTGGTVTGCTIYNNQHYGIKVGDVPLEEGGPAPDPKFVNITCNTIYQNYVDGIDLIGFDCTVKGNTVRDNAIYGIYVHGNNSTIYNNTIENNSDYGIKLYNSSGNYVYWNDIIDNNDGGVQGNDTWKGQPGLALNHWNTSTQVNYPYKCNNARSNYTGNYWDDYRDASDPDGIMDSPYPLDGGSAQDYYPLSVEWRLCGDVDRDGDADGGDVSRLRAYVRELPVSLCNPWAADVDCSGYLTGGDVNRLRAYIRELPVSLNCCDDC